MSRSHGEPTLIAGDAVTPALPIPGQNALLAAPGLSVGAGGVTGRPTLGQNVMLTAPRLSALNPGGVTGRTTLGQNALLAAPRSSTLNPVTPTPETDAPNDVPSHFLQMLVPTPGSNFEMSDEGLRCLIIESAFCALRCNDKRCCACDLLCSAFGNTALLSLTSP